jgi:AraC family transcriptional regulator
MEPPLPVRHASLENLDGPLKAYELLTQDTKGIEVLSLPAGRCASLVFQGPYAELEKAYSYLFGQWLPNSGEEMADFPAFEEYLNDPKTTPVSELLTRINCYLK